MDSIIGEIIRCEYTSRNPKKKTGACLRISRQHKKAKRERLLNHDQKETVEPLNNGRIGHQHRLTTETGVISGNQMSRRSSIRYTVPQEYLISSKNGDIRNASQEYVRLIQRCRTKESTYRPGRDQTTNNQPNVDKEWTPVDQPPPS